MMQHFLRRFSRPRLKLLPRSQLFSEKSRIRGDCDSESAGLSLLASSISRYGMMEPLLVRRKSAGHYVIISGERRLRAAAMTGLDKLPCIICTCTERESAALAVILDRNHLPLSCFDTAEAVRRVLRSSEEPEEDAAAALGLTFRQAGEYLRLLRFSGWQRERIESGGLSFRHARALSMVEDDTVRRELLLSALSKGETASQTEESVRRELEQERTSTRGAGARKSAIGDERLFKNSITNAVNMMRRAGVETTICRQETDAYTEYVIKVYAPADERANLCEF